MNKKQPTKQSVYDSYITDLYSNENFKHHFKIERPQTIDWYLHEALLKRNANISFSQGFVFPPELPDDYYEPIGIEYGRYKEWASVDKTMDEICMNMNEAVDMEQQKNQATASLPKDVPLEEETQLSSAEAKCEAKACMICIQLRQTGTGS